MNITNEANDWKAALSANTDDSSFDAKVATATEPVDTGVIELKHGPGNIVPGTMAVIPYGAGADDSTISIRVIGWSKIGSLWIPMILAEYDATLSTSVGVASHTPVNTDRFADTVSLVANMGTDAQGTTKVSPQNNTPAHFTVSIKGCQKVEIVPKKGTATNANALVRVY